MSAESFILWELCQNIVYFYMQMDIYKKETVYRYKTEDIHSWSELLVSD